MYVYGGMGGGGVIWYKSYDRTAASLHAERQRFHAASVFVLFFHHAAAHLLNAVGTGTFFCFHGRVDLDGWFLFRRIDAKKFHCDPITAVVNVTTVDNAAVATVVAAINTTINVAVLTTAVTFVGIAVLYSHLDHCQWRGTASSGTATAAALADSAVTAAAVTAAAIAVATAETAVAAAAAIAVATPEVAAAAIAVATAEAAAATAAANAAVGIGDNLNGRPRHGYTHCLRCQWLWRVLLATARTAGQLVQTEVRRV